MSELDQKIDQGLEESASSLPAYESLALLET